MLKSVWFFMLLSGYLRVRMVFLYFFCLALEDSTMVSAPINCQLYPMPISYCFSWFAWYAHVMSLLQWFHPKNYLLMQRFFHQAAVCYVSSRHQLRPRLFIYLKSQSLQWIFKSSKFQHLVLIETERVHQIAYALVSSKFIISKQSMQGSGSYLGPRCF